MMLITHNTFSACLASEDSLCRPKKRTASTAETVISDDVSSAELVGLVHLKDLCSRKRLSLGHRLHTRSCGQEVMSCWTYSLESVSGSSIYASWKVFQFSAGELSEHSFLR